MNSLRLLCTSLLAAALALPAFRPTLHAADALAAEWKQVEKKGGVTLYQRDHPGTSIKEIRAVGTFDSPNWMVRNVLDDSDHYTEFMPHIVASRVLSRDPATHTILTYAEINPPMVSRRDYTILITDASTKGPTSGEMTYLTRWQDANTKGPAEKSGVVRVKNNEGSWLLEPIDDGQHTKATYTLFTDGGGGIPSGMLNYLNKQRLVELYDIVGKRAQKEQYRKTKPVLP